MFINDEVKNMMLKLKPAILKNSFPKIFSWRDLEPLLNFRPYNTKEHRFHVNNCTTKYSWGSEAWVLDSNSVPPSIINDIIQKHHCIYNDASRVNEKVNQVCKEIEQIFPGTGADAHIFFNLSNVKPKEFGVHFDKSYNLIVQFEGKSRFQIWDKKITGENGVRPKEDPIIDEVLECGDIAFIPIHVYHDITSLSKRLSISFPFTKLQNNDSSQDRYWISLKDFGVVD